MLDLPLPFLERPASDAIDQKWLLVMLHGMCGNERDVFELAPQVPDCFHVLSVRGPFPAGEDAWRWFDFEIHPDDSRTIDEAQESESRARLGELVWAASSQLGIDAESVVIGGFSQGGVMALSLLLTRPELARAAMVMHSRLLPQIMPLIARPEDLRQRQLWLSYGTDDAVIPLKFAHEIRTAMTKLPVRSTYTEFPGGHELSPAEIFEATQWLSELVAMG